MNLTSVIYYSSDGIGVLAGVNVAMFLFILGLFSIIVMPPGACTRTVSSAGNFLLEELLGEEEEYEEIEMTTYKETAKEKEEEDPWDYVPVKEQFEQK